MKNINNKEIINKYKGFIFIIIISIIIGILGEVFYNLPINKHDHYQYIDIDSIKMDNLVLIEGSKFYSENGDATLTFEFEKQYVDKLTFDYSTELGNTLKCEIVVRTYEDGENPIDKVISDINNYTLKKSTINIREVSDKIILRLGSDASGTVINNIAIDNTGNISEWRILFVSICAFMILSLIFCWIKALIIPLENIFLIICISVGILGIGALPTHKVGFDEEIHFGRSYFWEEIVLREDVIKYPYGIEELRTTSLSNWPYHLPRSEAEYKEENIYRNKANAYDKEETEIEWRESTNEYKFELSTIAYIFQWLMIKINMFLGMPFSVVYRMGRVGNLLLYALVVFFSIRHLTMGKRILFVLALMPTNMLTAMTYSYDAWVNAFAFLGTSYLLEEWFGKRDKITYRNFVIILVSFILSSLPKAIYIPLLVLAMLLPKEKFRNKKEMYILKSIVIICVLTMLSTFVLPAIISPSALGGDIRGGDTSVARQLTYIFTHPLHYTKLLLNSIKDTFFTYTIGQEGLGRMGHLEPLANGTWIIIAICYVVFTDNTLENVKEVQLWQKVSILCICFCVICLIWTALYLAFTPVAANSIAGVHGRYYLPVTMWILWAIRNDKIENRMHKSKDHVVLTTLSLIILLPEMYYTIISSVF